MQPRFPGLVVSGTLLVVVALLAHVWMSGTALLGTSQAVVVTPGEAVVTTGHSCPGGLVTCDATDDDVPWWLLALALSPLTVRRTNGTRLPAPVTSASRRRRPTPVTDAVVLLE